MPKTLETPQERFDRLIAQLDTGAATPSARRKGFGTGSLFIGKKMFGLLGEGGELVVKLPAERVRALIRSGQGAGWHPGAGPPLKEYVAIPFSRQGEWLALAKESRAYMAGKS
jgi:hypothetical protein